VANAARDLSTAEALALEFDAFAGYVGSPDLREGLSAFRERPRFSGR
jgi:enoyl-CoA hydratase/carnithine racemase